MRPPNKSRSRNKNNRRNNNSGGGNALNRVYDSAGPDGRVRGTPVQVIEKYQALAHDHSLAGDRVAMENFQQHAEHYIRMINEVQRQIAERRELMESQNRNGGDENQNQRNAQSDKGGKRPKDAPTDLSQSAQPDLIDPKVIPNMKGGNEAKSLSDESSQSELTDVGELVETPEGRSDGRKPAAPKAKRQPRSRKSTQGETGETGLSSD